MKKIFILIALLMSATFANAAFQISALVTTTNAPNTNGSSFTLNSDTRTGTNAISSTTYATNTSIGGITTNLFNHILRFKFVGEDYAQWVSTNSFRIWMKQGYTITNVLVGNNFSVTLTTNTIGALTTNVSVPLTNVYSIANASNIVDTLIDDLNRYASRFINKTTNGVNYGSAFQSYTNDHTTLQLGYRASAVPSYTNFPFGLTNAYSIAIGKEAVASGFSSIAIGTVTSASTNYAIAIGDNAVASATNAIAIGFQAVASADGGTALGVESTATHSNSTAVGYGAATTADSQVMLGTSTVDVKVNNKLSVGGLIQHFAHLRTNVTTLAAGVNILNPADRTYIKVSGPTNAFQISGITNGTDGRVLIIQNSTGFDMAILNESGLSGADSNRIQTGTGGTSGITNTNNPGIFKFIYDSSTNRWIYTGRN